MFYEFAYHEEIKEPKFDKNEIIEIKNNIKKLEKIIPVNENKINNQLMNLIIDKEKKIDELVNNKNNEIMQNKDVIETSIKKEHIDKPLDLIINDQVIVYREIDKFINATQLCKAGGKKFNDWFRLDSTKELINELDKNINKFNAGILALKKSNKRPETGNPASAIATQNKFIENNKGGNDKNNQNTWIHPDLAIQLAQWISPRFALQVSSWIRTLFTNGKVEANIELLKEKDKRIKLLEDLTLQKQKRTDYPEKNVIYLLTT